MVCGRREEVWLEEDNMNPVPGLDFVIGFDFAVKNVRRASKDVGIEDGEARKIGRMSCGMPRFPAEYTEVRSIAIR